MLAWLMKKGVCSFECNSAAIWCRYIEKRARCTDEYILRSRCVDRDRWSSCAFAYINVQQQPQQVAEVSCCRRDKIFNYLDQSGPAPPNTRLCARIYKFIYSRISFSRHQGQKNTFSQGDAIAIAQHQRPAQHTAPLSNSRTSEASSNSPILDTDTYFDHIATESQNPRPRERIIFKEYSIIIRGK